MLALRGTRWKGLLGQVCVWRRTLRTANQQLHGAVRCVVRRHGGTSVCAYELPRTGCSRWPELKPFSAGMEPFSRTWTPLKRRLLQLYV